MKHFIAIADYSPDELRHVLDVAHRLKKQLQGDGPQRPVLAGKTLAMIFEKPSLRTRVSFAVGDDAARRDGAACCATRKWAGQARAGAGRRARAVRRCATGSWPARSSTRRSSSWRSGRRVPVINGLTDYNHPCQAMADLHDARGALRQARRADAGVRRRRQQRRAVAGRRRAGSSACGSSSPRPPGYELPDDDVDRIMSQVPRDGLRDGARPDRGRARGRRASSPTRGSAWARRRRRPARLKDFAGFQVDEQLLAQAPEARGRAALPAGVPRLRDQRRRDGGPAVAGLPGSREPAALPEGAARGADGRDVGVAPRMLLRRRRFAVEGDGDLERLAEAEDRDCTWSPTL